LWKAAKWSSSPLAVCPRGADAASDGLIWPRVGCASVTFRNGGPSIFFPCANAFLAKTRKSPARLGAAFDGSRLSKLYAEDLDHIGIIAKLEPLFAAYAAERKPGERFGAFVIRAGFVAPTTNGADFHTNTGAQRAV
jgi:hypothetical protein